MADENNDQPTGSRFRDYRGTRGAIDDAEGVPRAEDERRRNARGRTGVSRPQSPRTGVRYVDPESAREGEEGEPAYGPPMGPATPRPPSDREREAQPDPLRRRPQPAPTSEQPSPPSPESGDKKKDKKTGNPHPY